jgi:two-component system CheB/CheR fusion protein
MGRVEGLRLTVVDDSPEMLALLDEALRFDGAEIALFDGGVTLADIEQSSPDLLVIDLRLGADGHSGLDLIRKVRSHGRLGHVSIVVCSAAVDALAEHAEELDAVGALSILQKPFSLDQLESCVAEALANGRDASRAV